jgi:glutamate---cysteine ligase / carboxylate-amine ligase
MYSIGIEEEFFVFDLRTRRAVKRVNKAFFAEVKKQLGDRMTTEMLQSQIEVATPPCESTAQAREHLANYRSVIAAAAKTHGLGIAAMGTFPLAFWTEQNITRKARYDSILDDLQIVGRRNMLCGMHVHVAVPDVATRVNLMMRLTPYLPLLLALSTSSPFWEGHLTGLRGYRLAAYDESPRTGLPELFRTNDDYREFVDALVGAKIIPDESYIWWAIRPSKSYPTIELRVTDCCTRLDDAMAIAALFRCLVRALDRDRALNTGFDRVGRAITVENKWHAQRHGTDATFIDAFRRMPVTVTEWLDEVLDFIAEDIAALQCERDIARLRTIVAEGTSADHQIAVYDGALKAQCKRLTALKAVVDWAGQETLAG